MVEPQSLLLENLEWTWYGAMGLFQGRVILERALVTESDGIDEHMGDDWTPLHLLTSRVIGLSVSGEVVIKFWGKSEVLFYTL